jgi:hypothetical protein
MTTTSLLLGLAAFAAFALPGPLSVALAAPPEGPDALAPLLARYDRLAAGPERDALEREIDRVAGQRYAAVSRLYWHTDLARAEAAARQSGRPILSLRMLGRLDEDLSCANSRLFRATLYADAGVSKFLRDNFILHWSSERPVPKVTIDMGDGRTLTTTTTGNSAHYVLDADGHVLDVLPGLYAPVAFKAELARSLALARQTRGASDAARAQAVRTYQHALIERVAATWPKLANLPYLEDTLITSADVRRALQLAQRATMSKAFIEVPTLRKIGLLRNDRAILEPGAWASAGQVIYGIGDLTPVIDDGLASPARADAAPAKRTAPPRVLDDQARALIARLHGPATPAELQRVIERLEHRVVADSALNQLTLRSSIASLLEADPARSFDQLNAQIYAGVFHTPRGDEWLGLAPRTDFTGVPNDGRSTR